MSYFLIGIAPALIPFCLSIITMGLVRRHKINVIQKERMAAGMDPLSEKEIMEKIIDGTLYIR